MSRAAQVLESLEQQWRTPLRAVSLVAELDAADDDVRAAIRALGELYAEAWDGSDRYRLLHEQFSACLIVGLPGIGALDYHRGNYWTGVWEEAGLHGGQVDQAAWGAAFLDGLRRFRLPAFGELPQPYVGPILMHAGVPAYCLADYLNLLLRREGLDGSLSADALMSWAAAPGRESRLAAVDKPVQRFLRFGGDYAADFTDRSLELLDRLRAPGFDADGLRLPPRIIAKARELAEDGRLELRRSPSRSRAPRSAAKHPRLVLEPFGRGLLLWMPPVGEAPDGQAVWQVSLDGAVHRVPSRSLWPGAAETAPATHLSLAGPARRALIQLAGSHNEFEVDVVDPADPLLAFTDQGHRIPATSSLPPEPAWLLHPSAEDAGGHALEVTGTLQELQAVPVPYGWSGWQLHRVDLSAVSAVRFGEGKWRPVQGLRRPRLELSAPVTGARTVYDTPVIASAPRLFLPGEPGVPTDWSVVLRRAGVTAPLRVLERRVVRDEVVDPWEGLPRPLVGQYEVTVRGPLGRGMSRTVELVEGLAVEVSPPWREMRPHGLAPATVTTSSTSAGLQVSPQAVALGEGEASAQFSVAGPGGTELVRVTPAHMAVQVFGTGARAEWSLRPLRLETESLAEGKLLVRLPGAVPAQLVVRVGGTELQRTPSEATGGQALARFDLGRVADTVAKHGGAHLELEMESLRFPVARCEPRRLANAVDIDEGRVIVDADVTVDGLVVGLYQIWAPWRQPEMLAVGADGVTEPLPDRLRYGGPLLAALRVDDPWVPTPWPDWPGQENCFPLTGGGWSGAGLDSGEAELAGFLAGACSTPTIAAAVPFAMSLYRRRNDLYRCGVTVDVREVAAELLARHPAAVLTSVGDGVLPAREVVAPLVHAGLASLPRARYVSPEDEVRLWERSPLAAGLASSHGLGQGSSAELREAMVATLGPVAAEIAGGAADPYAQVGAFDAVVRRLAVLPPEQVEGIWRAATVVPQGLLEADERAAAARELFDVRTKPGIVKITKHAGLRLAELLTVIREVGGRRLADAVEARGAGTGWTALPALSLALALVSRLAARPARGPWPGLYRTLTDVHATLAREAPRLVTVDVLLAELLLIGAEG